MKSVVLAWVKIKHKTCRHGRCNTQIRELAYSTHRTVRTETDDSRELSTHGRLVRSWHGRMQTVVPHFISGAHRGMHHSTVVNPLNQSPPRFPHTMVVCLHLNQDAQAINQYAHHITCRSDGNVLLSVYPHTLNAGLLLRILLQPKHHNVLPPPPLHHPAHPPPELVSTATQSSTQLSRKNQHNMVRNLFLPVISTVVVILVMTTTHELTIFGRHTPTPNLT